ncbi:TIR domain-containing protein [Spiroplasma endosymbiont of Cantharis rufa]|uniref:TIR domain-containing protein n=1 Tax=Spiroplasma endosymbiont of Cantharis rufa TaxID=3066279 RepID=UPI0030D2C2B5
MNSNIHKVYISFKYTENKQYREILTNLNEKIRIFEDWSVYEGDIPNYGLTDEQIRIEIRDNYIKDSSVLILLNGKNMWDSKFIDWELHAAMYDGEENKKMGILIINLPEVENQDGRFNSSGIVKKITDENREFINWINTEYNIDYHKEKHPNAPNRIIKNLAKKDVKIDIINWTDIFSLGDSIAASRLIKLIDYAFNKRKSNNYDISDKLKDR